MRHSFWIGLTALGFPFCGLASADTIKRVSVFDSGGEIGASSSASSVSADGRYIAYRILSDGSGAIFIRDRLTGTTAHIISGLFIFRPKISADGRFLAFDSADGSDYFVDPEFDIYVENLTTGAREKISVGQGGAQATGDSGAASISASGRFVAFASSAGNLVTQDTNNKSDIFVRDRQAGATEIISVDSDEVQANELSSDASVSADGRFVAFASDASNLVAGDNNNQRDIFVRDRQTGITEIVSIASNGDRANQGSNIPSISPDGRFVAFASDATNLVDHDTNGQRDIFVHDRQTSSTEIVSINSQSAPADKGSVRPSISDGGRYVAFQSLAANLVAGDTNDREDIFLRDRQAGTTERLSVDRNGAQGNNGSSEPRISAEGRFVTFTSGASNLVPGDTNRWSDIFLRDRDPGPNDLLVDFGSRGLWQLMHHLVWPRINRQSPLGIAVGDLNGNGKDEAIAAFADIGLWARFDNATWTRLHSRTPNRFIAGNFDGNDRDDLAIDFGSIGLWARLNNATWTKLHNGSPQDLAVGDLDGGGSDELIGDFGNLGLWVRYNNAYPWVKKHAHSPLRIATGDLDGSGKDELIAFFNGLGLFARFNDGEEWVRLHGWLPEALATGDLDGEGKDELLADFGSHGLWAFYNNAGPWVKLHNTSPLRIVTTDIDSNGRDDAIASFPGLGLYARYNNAGAWVRLHSWQEQALAAGSFD